jgi:hypothetical protein
MKRLLTICIALALMLVLPACDTKETKNAEESDWLFSEEDLAQVNEDNVEAYINGEELNESTAKEMQEDFTENVAPAQGVPDGFPQSMPIYSGAEIFEADTYGDRGYTMVYMVSAPYASVVSFYQQAFPGVEKEYDEPDECYFENFDFDGGKVHINGLTITDNGNNTAVFITLKYN